MQQINSLEGVVGAIQDHRFQGWRRFYYICGEVGHLRANCAKAHRGESDQANLTLALLDVLDADEELWMPESESSPEVGIRTACACSQMKTFEDHQETNCYTACHGYGRTEDCQTLRRVLRHGLTT